MIKYDLEARPRDDGGKTYMIYLRDFDSRKTNVLWIGKDTTVHDKLLRSDMKRYHEQVKSKRWSKVKALIAGDILRALLKGEITQDGLKRLLKMDCWRFNIDEVKL